jgi:hypothetical protein
MGHTESPFPFLFLFDFKPQEAQSESLLDGFFPEESSGRNVTNGQSTYNLWFLFCQYEYFPCPPSRLRVLFLLQTKLSARKHGHWAEKASAGK